MDLKDKELLVSVILSAVITVIALLALDFQRNKANKERVDLQNQLASKDKTIETQKGVYEKLTLQESNVQNVLDSKDAQIHGLETQIKSDHESLESATSVSLQWKKAYEGLAKVQQSDGGTTVEPDGGVLARERVDFNENWGFIGAAGYTLTNPPESYLKIQQLRPLKLTVALSQGKDKAWHSYVTSSEENVGADIQVTAVNPYLLEPKWYEKLAIRGDLGVGSTEVGSGLLFGLGLTTELGRFDVGPAGWLIVTNRVDKFVGVMVGWHPFQTQQ